MVDLTEFDFQANRTMAILRELLIGRHLTLKNGMKIGMGNDFSIGYVMHNQTDDTEFIDGLSNMSFRDLNKICEENNISMPLTS